MFVSKAVHSKLSIYVFVLLGLLNIYTVNAQLVTQGNQTVQQLVQDVLLGGGVQAFNFTLTGSPFAIGTFNGANTNIGINSGVIMTTGVITGPDGPAGPNNVPYAGVDNASPGSQLLNQEFNIAKQTFNATIIRFDFIPQGDTVAFRYVFGSEEYKEFVGTEYNDVFGFFISGPDPAGGNYNERNIALIPGSNTQVAINNVNHLVNSSFFVDNETPPGSTIQYDGFTKVLTASARVIPCSTYTIKLAIADVSDAIYDSGVFLEAKSFSSDGVDIKYEVLNSISPDSIYEGCGTARVSFIRQGNESQDKVVKYVLLGTALNGGDHTLIPDSIVIPAGQTQVNIDITAFQDGINEPGENIIIQLIDDKVCPNVPLPSVTIPIVNVNPITVVARPDTALGCNNEVILLYANAQGGIGNLTYTWSNAIGVGNPVPVITRQTTTYYVTVTDQCGSTQAIDSVRVLVPNVAPLALQFSSDTAICPGEEVILEGVATGGVGSLTYSWSTGEIDTNRIRVTPFETMYYTMVVEDSCGNTLTGASLVTVRAPSADFTYRYIGNSTVRFTSTVSEDVVSWLWMFGDEDTSTLANPTYSFQDTGWYNVTLVVTNNFGCTDTVVKPVYSYPPYSFFIPNTYTPNGDGINEIFTGKGVGFVSYEMRIYDRWGQTVYETFDIKRGWPGAHSDGSILPIGVYVYQIRLKTPVGEEFEYIGHVNLIR